VTITESTTVGEIAASIPASVRVFQQHGVDFCCGGGKALAAVCAEKGLSFHELARAIDASADGRRDDRDWTREPLGAVIDHIVTTYHESLRQELPRLEGMAAKVARVHGGKAPFLLHLADTLGELSADLNEHMRKEEAVLFPAIRAIDGPGPAGRATWIAAPVAVMELEHDRAGELLAELRRTSGNYMPPDWACATFKALYQGLEELESSMHVHVHLENNVLFPRALNAAQGVA
jgi:regulator of cell morphogenesis and NO signaling